MTRMKESGIDWIGQIPQEWEVIKFKYLGDVKQGLTYSPSDIVDKDEGILVLRSGNIQNGVLDFTNNVYVKTKVAESIVLRKNDILITARNGSSALIGKNAIIDTDIKATFGAFMMVFRTNKSLIAKFAFYLMNISFNFYRTFFTTSTVNQLTAAIFNGIEVPLPSISEQQKIADFLDKKTAQLDKVKSLLEEQIQKLKDYRASLIYETVTKGLDKTVPMKDSGINWIGQVPQGWGVSKLKFILEKGSNSIKVGPFGSSLSGDAIRSSGKWVYNQRNVLDNNFTETDFYISEAKCKELKNFSVSSGDILLTTRGTIGRVAIVPKKYCEGIIHPCLMKFKVDSKIVLPELIKYLFNDIPLVREQLNFLSNSTTIDVIYSYNLKNIIIPTIPIAKQYSILEVLDRQTSDVDSLIKIKQKQIENINKQRQTLIYDYVTGKRRV